MDGASLVTLVRVRIHAGGKLFCRGGAMFHHLKSVQLSVPYQFNRDQFNLQNQCSPNRRRYDDAYLGCDQLFPGS